MQLTLVTLGGLLAAGIVSAAPQYQQSTSNVHRITQRDLTGYDNLGCYTEATSGRALSGKSYSNDSMTLELCQSTCQGFSYFGVEYGRECYCGNNLNTGSVSTASSDCNFACPGNATETCGAGNRLNVYQTTGSGPADFSKYGSHGCYTEPNNAQNGRALMGKTTVSNNMTVENCADICAAGQYSLFGVEYSSECYCGNMLAVGSVAAPASDCKYACSGDKTETCGGDWRFNYYEFGYTPAPSSTTSSATSATSSATSTSSTAASPTAPAGYTDAGCYTEATGQRALTGKSYFDDSMTVEKCAAACTGYEWFGVEYGREVLLLWQHNQ
ncbi:WSC containing protein [Glarea lozoyensis ATCC 20868]|uniref:WSC containing protein n=1 Tax=Glarea lozoyensis (strain ATCC 20868 / MF5171) TaxID=1116229 RepID=S3D211_GLAL2|nr:WSC containing protein [Glarea lozoyensis ATCC 20868]EPE31830.1 WSC containing protein [Glarea lozoyensis ATCC 20868]